MKAIYQSPQTTNIAVTSDCYVLRSASMNGVSGISTEPGSGVGQ